MPELPAISVLPDPDADLAARRAGLAMFSAHVHPDSAGERNTMVGQMVTEDIREMFDGLLLDDESAEQMSRCLGRLARRLMQDAMLLVVAAVAARQLEEEDVDKDDVSYMQQLLERMVYLNEPAADGEA